MAASRILTGAAAALLLAGCQGAHSSAGGGSAVCAPFAATAGAAPSTTAGTPATAAPLTPADPSSALDDCLHRWAYALAPASDDASHVGQAVLAACEPALGRWNQQAASAAGGAAPIEAPSLITGQPTSPIAQHLSFAQNRALFYVVQARAGHCAAPPMTNGAPTGLPRE